WAMWDRSRTSQGLYALVSAAGAGGSVAAVAGGAMTAAAAAIVTAVASAASRRRDRGGLDLVNVMSLSRVLAAAHGQGGVPPEPASGPRRACARIPDNSGQPVSGRVSGSAAVGGRQLAGLIRPGHRELLTRVLEPVTVRLHCAAQEPDPAPKHVVAVR